jgi:integrase
MGAISVDPLLSPRKKGARRTAIKTLCRGLRSSPEMITLSQLKRAIGSCPMSERTSIGGRLLSERALAPGDCGVSYRTFENVKAYARQALAPFRKGLISTRGVEMSEDWAALFRDAGDKTLLISCGRFARWATLNRIIPSAVDQVVADKYAADLGVSLETRNARQAFTSFCRGWNGAVATHDKWPKLTINIGDRRRVYALDASSIDEGFLQDLERMLVAFGSKLKLPAGMDSPFEESTIREIKRIFYRLYSVAVSKVEPARKVSSMADLVRTDVVEAILSVYLEQFGEENTKSANKYAHYLYVAAKYWVKAPAPDIEELHRFRKVTKIKSAGMTEKNRAMLRHFEDEEYADRLLNQGAEHLRRFLKIKGPKVKDALNLQDALAVALLTAAPVRPQNLASISIDRHLVVDRIGKRETFHLVFPASEVKNDVDLEFKLPPRVVALLKPYISVALPLLAEAGNRYLFPGHGHHHKVPSGHSVRLARWTLHTIGVRVTGHRFRHLLGFLYLKDNPSGQEVVQKFLGHKSIETTIAFYAGMEQARAVALFDDHMERLSKSLVASRKTRRPCKGEKQSRGGKRHAWTR